MARKSTYTPDMPERVKNYCRNGLVESQICKNIGIGHTQFNVWKQRYPELAEALKEGKASAVSEVENAIFKRAIGYEYEEVTTSIQNKGKEQYTEVKKVKKQIAGDVTAQIFILKNRKSAEWRDRQEIETIDTIVGFDVTITRDV
jgi:hypothetical protein